MKRMIRLILAAVLLCGMISCGKGEPGEKDHTADLPPETVGAAKETNSETEKAAETAYETPESEAEVPAVPETDSNAAETEAVAKVGGYVCELDNGMVIELGAVAEGVLDALGAPQNVAEAPSCIHEGMDRIYSFNGFSVTTSPDGKGADRVQEVALTSDAVLLKNGISIGSSLDAVKAAFGSDCTEQFGVLQYITDHAKISIVLDDDSCVSSLVITAAE